MNVIDLHIFPRQSISWEEFLSSTPEFSIALDGYVSAPPQYDPSTHHLNLDHHHDVFRQSVMSTAQQAMMAVKGGIFSTFKQTIQGVAKPHVHVFVNDCDQDVVLALFILEHHKLFEGTNSIPTFNRLLEIDGKLDITAGAYPYNLNEDLFQQHEWVFEPYNNLRTSGKIGEATPQMLLDNIEATMGRIMQFVMGNAGKVNILLEHSFFHTSNRYWALDETVLGLHSRYHSFSQGMRAYISLVSTSPSGNVYTIGRSSVFIDFNVPFLLDMLDRIEGLEDHEKNPESIVSLEFLSKLPKQNKWGGSDLVGGSRNSSISAHMIGPIIDKILSMERES